MASRYEVEVTITSAKDLKNVNWRNGRLKPYAVVWVDRKNKCSTRVDEEGETCPYWDAKLVIPLSERIDESTLYIDIVHADATEDMKPLIGSARLNLRDVTDDVGLGERATRKLEMKRPSGRPQGKIELTVTVREPSHRAPEPFYALPYGVPPNSSRDYVAPPAYGNSYAPPPPNPYDSYGAQPHGQPAHGLGAPPVYGQESYGQQKEEKKSKFGGMGTGLAVGTVAGVLGGLAIAEGVDYVEDKISDDVAEKVEDDLGVDDF